MISIILQVTSDGSVSASWVLVVLCAIVGALSLTLLADIRNNIKSVATRQNEQEKEIAKVSVKQEQTQSHTDYAHERIDSILTAMKK